jgi:hypothetical protein
MTMRVGLSYSRCIRDIVLGNVDINDVLVVVARTDFDPTNDQQWAGIWRGYGGGKDFDDLSMLFSGSNPEWAGTTAEDEQLYRQVSIDLWNLGKFHQPRKFGAHPARLDYYWLEVGLPSEEMEHNPAVKRAWEQFQIVAGLSKVKKDSDFNNDF